MKSVYCEVYWDYMRSISGYDDDDPSYEPELMTEQPQLSTLENPDPMPILFAANVGIPLTNILRDLGFE